MSFLAPLFLIALAGLAIPVLLHLTQREKKQIVRFPSLMFVRRIPYQSVRRRKVQNWLLLMLRLAALALIALAFARPFITGAAATAVPGVGARELVILLDTSYSMGQGDRWERARGEARSAIASLSPVDRGSLVLFSSGTDIVAQSTARQEQLTAAVAAATPGAGATRFAPALKVAGSILAESLLPRREVVMISDFQRVGWRGEEGARLPPGATLKPVLIGGASEQPNFGISGVSLARSTFSGRERIAVTAAVINRGDRPATTGVTTSGTTSVTTSGPTSGPTSTVTLDVGGIPVGSRSLSVEPGASASTTFDPFTIVGPNTRATVRISNDALAADNAFYFVVSPSQPLRVTVVDSGNAADALYLMRALAIGDAPRFEAKTRLPDAVTDDDLRQSAVVLLDDVAVSPGLARRLTRFVNQGGGLLVAAGARATWPADVDLLPGSLGERVDRTRGTVARVGSIEFGHPVFEPFRAPRSGDFSSTRIYGYRIVTPVSAGRVLARFDAGTPAMIERQVGAGRVLLWATTFDTAWSDLPIKPVFLPLIHQSLQYLARYREPEPWSTVGQVLNASATASQKAPSRQREVRTPSGKRLSLDEEGGDVVALEEQGFYELRSGGNGRDVDVAVVASNVDPAESDLTPMDPKDVVIAAAGLPSTQANGDASGVPMTPEAREKNQRLWWFLLCVGVVVLAADTILSNRLGKA